MGDCSEIVFHRMVRLVVRNTGERDRIELEADARVSSGIRAVEPRNDELDEIRRPTYRSAAMSRADRSQDRPESACGTKEIARSMQTPGEASWMASVKRTVRCCMGTPRVVWRFEKQALWSYLDVRTDRDHAGCTKARRSTSAAALMPGHDLLRFPLTTQTVVALSSGG